MSDIPVCKIARCPTKKRMPTQSDSVTEWSEPVNPARRANARCSPAGWRSTATPWPRSARGSVRWNLVKLIQEYARHNGHPDLLRERIDGATGE
jgi:hypothetical protein